MRQISFLAKMGYSADRSHGGGPTKGRRKVRRPLDVRHPVHLVLRSSKAKGVYSLLRPKNRDLVYKTVTAKAKKFKVRLEGYANVGNHLHMKIRFSDVRGFQKFLKAITNLIARQVTGARKGKPFGKFWDALAYTKVVKVWAQERRLDRYIVANAIESEFGRGSRELYLRGAGDSS